MIYNIYDTTQITHITQRFPWFKLGNHSVVVWEIVWQYGELPGNQSNYLNPGGLGKHGEQVICS